MTRDSLFCSTRLTNHDKASAIRQAYLHSTLIHDLNSALQRLRVSLLQVMTEDLYPGPVPQRLLNECGVLRGCEIAELLLHLMNVGFLPQV